jgi:hypothetical protein
MKIALASHIATLTLLVFAASSASVNAARPMITDDARLVDTGGCQVESWLRREPRYFTSANATEFWALPACNPWGNLEMTLGGATRRVHGIDANNVNSFQAQIKTLFLPVKADDWGIGLAIGAISKSGSTAPANIIDNTYFYVPISRAFSGEKVVLHLNLGAQYDRNAHRSTRTWGFGSEIEIHPRLFGIVETFGESGGRPYQHGGLRFWLIPTRVQLDSTIGRRRVGNSGAADERWGTIGVRILFPPT